MTELKDKIIGYTTFTIVLFMHVYFALLLGSRTAFAAETAPAPAKVEKSVAPAASPQAAAAPDKSVTDTEINIKVDPKDGVSVKGLDKLVEKLDALDKHHKVDSDATEVDKDDNGALRINKRFHIGRVDEDDSDDDGGSLKIGIGGARGSIAEEVILPIAVVAIVFSPIVAFFFFQYRTRREAMETVRMFLEKGQPIPPDMMEVLKKGGSVSGGASEWDGYQSHILKGLKPIFWGLGILLFFVMEHFGAKTMYSLGMICILVGVYHVTKSYLIQQEKNKTPAGAIVTDAKIITDSTPKV